MAVRTNAKLQREGLTKNNGQPERLRSYEYNVAVGIHMCCRGILDTATEQQVADSGMLEILAAAIVTRDRLIHQAAELLKPLEISEEVLQSLLVRSVLERQAKTKIE